MKDKYWMQNIEYIFTEKELKQFVKSKHLESFVFQKEKYYVKRKCKIDFVNILRKLQKK